MSIAPVNRKKLGLACAGKNRYSTYDRAVAVAVVRTGARREAPRALGIYPCPHCQGFHLTKQVQGKGRRWPVITA